MWRVIPALENYSQSTREPCREQAGCTGMHLSPSLRGHRLQLSPEGLQPGVQPCARAGKAAQQQPQKPRLLPHMLRQCRMHRDLPQCWGGHSGVTPGTQPCQTPVSSSQQDKTPRPQSVEMSPPGEHKLSRVDGLHIQHWLEATTRGLPVTEKCPAIAPTFSPHRCSMQTPKAPRPPRK